MKVEQMSSKQAAERLKEADAEAKENGERLEAIRLPAALRGAVHAGVSGAPGRERDPTEGAGPEWLEAHEAGDVEKLAELDAERREREAKAGHLAVLRDQLRQRVRLAAEEEAKAKAPKDARQLARAAPEALEEVEAAYAAFQRARGVMRQLLSDLAAARNLAGDDAEGLAPEILARWWRVRDGAEFDVFVPEAAHQPGAPSRVLNTRYVQEAARLLKLPASAISTVRDYLVGGRSEKDVGPGPWTRAEASARADVLREVVRRVAAGTPLPPAVVARTVIENTSGGRRESPARRKARADSWLASRSRDDVPVQTG